jgi:protein-S-isoprenylcysteine O-methyltransferase Ste14
MNAEYTILLCIFAVCLTTQTSYELLKKAGKVNLESRILFTVVLIAMILLWMSWFGMCPMDPLPVNLSDFVRTAGFILFLAGLVFAFATLVQLRGVENIDHLVTTGLFAFTRHPMYLGFIFWIVGWSVYHGAALSFLAGCVGIVNIFFWCHLEEEKSRRELRRHVQALSNEDMVLI